MKPQHQPLNVDSNIFRVCLCCHVKTGTLLYGILNAVVQLIVVVLLIVAAIRPDVLIPKNENLQPYDAIRVVETDKGETLEVRDYIGETSMELQANGEKLQWMFGITLICLVSSLLMIYGIVRNRAGYVLPFFVLCVFDLTVTCLSIIGGFTYTTDMKQWIQERGSVDYPFMSYANCLDSNYVALVVVLFLILILTFKAYMVHMVWLCYKYIQIRVATRNMVRDVSVYPDAEMLLPPSYESVTKMAIPANSSPPPAYSQE